MCVYLENGIYGFVTKWPPEQQSTFVEEKSKQSILIPSNMLSARTVSQFITKSLSGTILYSSGPVVSNIPAISPPAPLTAPTQGCAEPKTPQTMSTFLPRGPKIATSRMMGKICKGVWYNFTYTSQVI